MLHRLKHTWQKSRGYFRTVFMTLHGIPQSAHPQDQISGSGLQGRIFSRSVFHTRGVKAGNTGFEYLQTVIAAGGTKHSCLQRLDVLNVLKAFLINKCERFEPDGWVSMNALMCLTCFIAFHPVLLSSCCDASLRPPDASVKNNIFQSNFNFLKNLKTFN